MTQNAPPLENAPANRFTSTPRDSSQAFLRSHLISTRLPAKTPTPKAIIIEAQAGQGKTTLASQYLAYHGLDSLWCQLGPEDSDQHLFATSLLRKLAASIPGADSSLPDALPAEVPWQSHDFEQHAAAIIQGITASFPHDVYLVLDDLHQLEEGSPTIEFIEHLIDTSPARLHFLLISRFPIRVDSKKLCDSQAVCYLDTKDLALSPDEIQALSSALLKQPISRQDALRLEAITEGWIMGIMLICRPLAGRALFWQTVTQTNRTSIVTNDHLRDYFQSEVLANIPEAHYISLLKLAVLVDIPEKLAEDITDVHNIAHTLSWLARHNLFTYRQNRQKQSFRFQRLFQDYLQTLAEQHLDEKEISSIQRRETNHYVAAEMVGKALACYLKSSSFKMMEHLLREKSSDLIIRDDLQEISALLQTIPENKRATSGWLTLFAGLAWGRSMPKNRLHSLEKARHLFRESNDETGELIALSQTVLHHFAISGSYNQGAELLPHLEKLLLKNIAHPLPVQIMAKNSLALGLCFFRGEMAKARMFSSQAISLGSRENLHNITISCRSTQGYIDLLSGNSAQFMKEAEVCYSELHNPQLSQPNKLAIRMLYLCHLSMTGDHLNFLSEQQALEADIGKEIIAETIAAPYLHIWGSSNLFALGKTDDAMDLLNRGIGTTASLRTDHMYSQILQWQAFGHAIQGANRDALNCINESIQLRKKAGAPFQEAFNDIIAGAVYSRLNMPEMAEFFLSKGIPIAAALPTPFLLICGYMNRSFHSLVTGKQEAACRDLKEALNLMKQHRCNHFWTWEPTMMFRLLSLAVHHNIETAFARQLAEEKLDIAFTTTGEILPVLHFSLLDAFQISIGRQVLFRASNFTPSQRQLLGVLLTVRGQRISQERLQLEHWPDSPPENARASFDTLLTRLRKELSTKITVSVKKYLTLQKGILELNHSCLDADLFTLATTKGMQHSRNSEWWQAGMAFRTALSYWKGLLPEENFCNEATGLLSDQLVSDYKEISRVWAEYLVQRGQFNEAITLLEQGLLPHFQDEHLIRLLYALYLKTQNYLKAANTVERYKIELEKMGYTRREVEKMLAEDSLFSPRSMHLPRDNHHNVIGITLKYPR